MTIENRDPLLELHQTLGFDCNDIHDVIFGSAYTFVSHLKHYFGVASTLSESILEIPSKINFDNIAHRTLLLAYYNSIYNTTSDYKQSTDLIQEMNLKASEKISMIGFFRPLVPYFAKSGILPVVFDDFCSSPEVTANSEKPEQLYSSDVLIITATSLINNTFCKEIALLNSKARIYILGPSALMIPYFKEEYGVERIFGSIIMNDDGVKQAIIKGGGTPSFSSFVQKAVF